MRDAIAKAQEPTLKKIPPYFVTERRTLANGDSDVIQEGNNDDALRNFEQARQSDGMYAQDVARVKKRIREEEKIRAARAPESAGS